MNPAEIAITNYLTALRDALKGLRASECDEIVSESGGHLRDAVAQGHADVGSVVAQLGPPADLAAQYRETLLLKRTTSTLSPWLLLCAAFRLLLRNSISNRFTGVLRSQFITAPPHYTMRALRSCPLCNADVKPTFSSRRLRWPATRFDPA